MSNNATPIRRYRGYIERDGVMVDDQPSMPLLDLVQDGFETHQQLQNLQQNLRRIYGQIAQAVGRENTVVLEGVCRAKVMTALEPFVLFQEEGQ